MEPNREKYIDFLIEEEKRDFCPGPFESETQHVEKVREQFSHALDDFYIHFENGYKVICDELDAQGLKKPEVADENLKIFDDLDVLMQALDEGKTLYELLGFTFDTLTDCYKVLMSLYEKEEYEKLRDGFFFLITLSPETEEYWLGLGIASNRLKEYDKALDAFYQALDMNPGSQDGYLGALHAYVMSNRHEEANRLCDEGIDIAKSSSEELWSQELETLLLEAKKSLDHPI